MFTAAALLTVIATALLANLAGLSMSLGAFLAGVLLADSEFRHELEADIEPFKGLLLGPVLHRRSACRPTSGCSTPAAASARRHRRTICRSSSSRSRCSASIAAVDRSSWRLGFTLPAGGEFAFVLFTLAARQRILDDRDG